MSEFLLDTNVVSELRKGSRADVGVIDFVEQHPADSFWLSVIVVGELSRGIELLRRRDRESAELLDVWFLELVDEYEERILAISPAIALQWGSLGIPDPLPVADALIAATGLEHDLIVVSRNLADIARSGVECLNPFAA